ncbi:MAG: radical SAM protein [Spirochaetaceae bacterium]|nr:radical SAM protein [Spirochaetaceae bacterium]
MYAASDKAPRRLLKPADLVDNFTAALYKVAPYRACAHGCRYCDGRAEKYYVEGDFERDIQIREDIPSRLAAELPSLRERGMIAFGSGVTDPYQPCEAEKNLTGQAASILADHAEASGKAVGPAGSLSEADLFGKSTAPCVPSGLVMTKSALALRDLPAWKRLNERSGFMLLVSLTSLDEEVRELMEPGASSFEERLALLKAYKEAGCLTGILAMPFLPGLSDDEASIRRLYEAATAVGVDYLMPGGLTLRPGRQKELYLATLAKARPELLAPTKELFQENRPSGMPTGASLRRLSARIASVRRDYHLPYLMPHEALTRLLPPHDAFRVLLRHMAELYKERHIDTSALMRSAQAYDDWLLGLRREFRRHRKLPATWLEERFAEGLHGGEFFKVLANQKLERFAAAVLLEGATFDFISLKLRPSNVSRET